MKASMTNSLDQDNESDLKECDVVMKGGVASGIIYPPVIIELAKKYRLRSIGGTSAGAIAAAVTAAAEYKRESCGFERLKAASKELQDSQFLSDLFQASPEFQPLMDLLLKQGKDGQPLPLFIRLSPSLIKIFKFSGKGIALGLLPTFILAALSLVFFSLISHFTSSTFNFWSFVAPFCVIAILLVFLGCWLVNLYKMLFEHLPNKFFGICSGYDKKDSSDQPKVLTNWLCKKIDEIAESPAGTPLTFGDLRYKKFPNGTPPDHDKGEKNIELKMITTNLSHNRPYTLPFREDHLFLFHEDEFRELFPEYVVERLKSHTCNSRSDIRSVELSPGKSKIIKLPTGSKYHFLPKADDLPVIVATRMSLSFPILFSAVPLYTIRASVLNHNNSETLTLDLSEGSEDSACTASPNESKKLRTTPKDLQRNWFSDGGICSNFPLHFFDAWLPGRPTFGINLTSIPSSDKDSSQSDEVSTQKTENLQIDQSLISEHTILKNQLIKIQEEDVHLPKANDPDLPDWIDLDEDLPRFLWQTFLTAQNYRENMQSRLPGYQERIVQIRLGKGEGGLNLWMPKETIKKITDKGKSAGETLCSNNFDFEQHQWVRLQLLLGLLEEKLVEIETEVLGTEPKKLDYEKLLKDQQAKNYPYHYPINSDQSDKHAEKAKDCIERMQKSAKEVWGKKPPSLSEQLPHRKPSLRITPEF